LFDTGGWILKPRNACIRQISGICPERRLILQIRPGPVDGPGMSLRPAKPLLLALVALAALPAGALAAAPVVTHVDTPQQVGVDLAGQVRTSRLAGVRAPSTAVQALPTTWCGTERSSDDTADSALSPGQAYYKLVYAHASDQPDRFAQWQDVLQADVSLIGQYMAMQDGATKAPRFDMGTSCGPQYADIQAVGLPGSRASYADQFDAIAAAVRQQLGTASGPRNVVILADGLTNSPAGSLYGLGQTLGGPGADAPGATNPHNSGGLNAILFAPLNYDPAVQPGQRFYPGFWAEGMLHEMTHTLGAVLPNAPHATSYGHCTDGYDVMCYADGGYAAAPYSTTACPQLTGTQAGMTQTYDCGHDDYFSPAPAAGSYLATHWNIYDSAFEAPCDTLGAACGSAAPAPGAGDPSTATSVASQAPAPAGAATTRPAAKPRASMKRRADVALVRRRRTVVRLRVSSRTTAGGQVASVAARRVRLRRRGTYRLTLCAGIVCASKPLRARRGRARVPAIVAATTRPGRVTLTLLGPGGRAKGVLA
jgi:hypothetical protein